MSIERYLDKKKIELLKLEVKLSTSIKLKTFPILLININRLK